MWGLWAEPTDQAWIETLFGHVKTEWPHLEKITDPNTLRAELDIARHDYNTRRLHASLGYVTPDDEHHGRAERIRQARQDGLNRARLTRIAYHRNNKALRVFVGLRVAGTGWVIMSRGCRGLRSCVGW